MRSRSACGGLLRRDVDRAQRLGQRRQRLHRGARVERIAGRHAALQPAGVVRLAVVAALRRPEDLVVRLRARLAGEVEALPQPDALDRLDRAQRAGDPAVEALLPGDVRAEPRHEPEGDDLEDAADRLVGLALDVDVLRPSRGSPRGPGSARDRRRRRRSRRPSAAPSRSGASTLPIWTTCERTSTPSARRNARASAPPATRAAVSRALARSSTLRTSVKSYFCVPTRSAWPGRGRCTSGTSASTGHGFIRSSQLA